MTWCPHCQCALVPCAHAGVLRCARCGGHLLGAAATRQLMGDCSVKLPVLAELAQQGAPGFACGKCHTPLKQFLLKGATVDACVTCGNLWLDAGELAKISRGTWEDHAPAAPWPPHAPLARQDRLAQGEAVAPFLMACQFFRIRQCVESAEVWLGLDLANRYVIDTAAGVINARETDTGLWAGISRNFLRGFRTVQLAVTDPLNNDVIFMHRPPSVLPFIRRTTNISTLDGTTLGKVHQEVTFINNIYTLENERGRPWATVKRNLWGAGWKFKVTHQVGGEEVALIEKTWGGFFREGFTNADTFNVTLGQRAWTVQEKAVLLCTALLMDLNHFERKPRRGTLRLGLQLGE